MALLVFGVLQWKWYIDQIAVLFLGMGIVLGFAGGMGPSRVARTFVTGAKDMVGVVFIVACARALLVIANDARILDTVLHAASNTLSVLPLVVMAQVMFLIQAVINFFIHSGTAQAALTMPVMAPLADLVGITRQTAVYAFQLCEFVNPILPTSAVTMGVLGAAKPEEVVASSCRRLGKYVRTDGARAAAAKSGSSSRSSRLASSSGSAGLQDSGAAAAQGGVRLPDGRSGHAQPLQRGRLQRRGGDADRRPQRRRRRVDRAVPRADPYKYLFKVRNVTDTFRAMNEAVMREVVGDRTVTEVLTVGRQAIETRVEELLRSSRSSTRWASPSSRSCCRT
jgi:hypothetical protein